MQENGVWRDLDLAKETSRGLAPTPSRPFDRYLSLSGVLEDELCASSFLLAVDLPSRRRSWTDFLTDFLFSLDDHMLALHEGSGGGPGFGSPGRGGPRARGRRRRFNRFRRAAETPFNLVLESQP